MKIYYHPASTTSRPLVLFAEENGLKVDLQLVDLFTGAHYNPEVHGREDRLCALPKRPAGAREAPALARSLRS